MMIYDLLDMAYQCGRPDDQQEPTGSRHITADQLFIVNAVAQVARIEIISLRCNPSVLHGHRVFEEAHRQWRDLLKEHAGSFRAAVDALGDTEVSAVIFDQDIYDMLWRSYEAVLDANGNQQRLEDLLSEAEEDALRILPHLMVTLFPDHSFEELLRDEMFEQFLQDAKHLANIWTYRLASVLAAPK